MNDYLLEEDEPLLSSTIERIWHPLLKNWDLRFLEVQKQPDRDMRREPQNSSIPVPRFQIGGGLLNHTGGTSHSGMIDYTRCPISEKHLGQCPDSMEFPSWKVNFKAEIRSKSADPALTMHWIKEVEKAKSIDELVTSRSTLGRNDFPVFDMLDAMIASALKRLLDKRIRFRKKSKCRRAARSKIPPILTRETNCLHDLRAFPCNRSL